MSIRALRFLRSSGLLLLGLLLAAFFVALLFLLPREFLLLQPRLVLLRALLLSRVVLLGSLHLLGVVLLRSPHLLGVVLPSALPGALLIALRIRVVSLIPPAPTVVVAIAVVVMNVVIIIVLVDRDVDATRRRVAPVAIAPVVGAIAAVRAASSIVPARRPGRREAPGKGDRQRGEQDRREPGERGTSRGMWAHAIKGYSALPAAVRLPFICSSSAVEPRSAFQPSRKVRNTQ